MLMCQLIATYVIKNEFIIDLKTSIASAKENSMLRLWTASMATVC